MEKISYKLAAFEGPLDLLLYLIKKNKLNICDIQIAELLDQYIAHIEQMKEENMDVSSEFLEMAARLVYIKSVLLLPHREEAEELKQELEGQLVEYEQCKQAAVILAQAMKFDFIARDAAKIEFSTVYDIRHNVFELQKAYFNAVGRQGKKLPPPRESFSEIISKKIVTVFSKAVFVLKMLKKLCNVEYNLLFCQSDTKSASIATFLAILELIRRKRIVLNECNGKMYLLLNDEVERVGAKRG